MAIIVVLVIRAVVAADRAAGTRHANGGAGICRAAVASSVAR
jgi:hypothetical protein